MTSEDGSAAAGERPMRMRGLGPPRVSPHTDLNRARLPIPPHPRGAGADDSNGSVAKLALPWPPSSRGLGRRPLTAETGVRIPVAVLDGGPSVSGLFSFQGRRCRPDGRGPRAAREALEHDGRLSPP